MKTLFVTPLGNDAWHGEFREPRADRTDGPLASLARARDVLRVLKAREGLPPGGATVEVAAGVYRLEKPLALSDEDSGTPAAPIVYRAAPGAVVRLSGGVAISDWEPVTEPAVLARLAPGARGRVVRASLPAHGVTDFGAMESASSWAHSDPGLEVFCRDQPMTLARYPNEGFLHIASLSVEDGYHIRGTRGSRVGRFRVAGEAERLRRWSNEPAPMLHGYWFYDWADQRIAIAAMDPDTGEITLDDRSPHRYGYRIGQWFYAFNLLCELDRPGEWYLDRSSGILYFWPPHELRPGDVVVSVLRDPVTLDNVRDVALQGFTIEAARGTAVRITGGEAVTIAGCTIRNVGADAVRIQGGRGHRVCDCDIYQTGDGGIQISGGDRLTLTPGGHEAVNNHIHHIARWNPLYKVGIQLKGVGNRAAHNRLHDLPHTAIGFTENEQCVEYNEIYRVCTQANDAGAIYTAGTHPEDWSMRGHRVRFNYLHHCFGFRQQGCSGIYLDDMFSATEITGNLIHKVFWGLHLGGGRDLHVRNNALVECPVAIHLDARALGWAAFSMPDVIAAMERMPYRKEPWASRYPELVHILDDEPACPKGNIIERNILSRCAQPYDIEDKARPGLRQADNLEADDPGFADAERLDFRLRADSPARSLGFEPIPLDRIGLQPSPLRPQIPPRRGFEARFAVLQPPLLRQGRPKRPGVATLRVRNIGDAADTGTFRLRVGGGHLDDDAPWTLALEPFAQAERRFELHAESRELSVEVLGDALSDVRDETEGTRPQHTRRHGRDYPFRIEAADECMTPWPASWQVSAPQPGAGRLETLDAPPQSERLGWRLVAVEPGSHFCNVHNLPGIADGGDAVVYFRGTVHCAEDMRVAAWMGYDGPVKLFINGVSVFHDPDGTNPARPDSAAPQFDLAAGDHELVVALGTNGGKAWGIFLRLLRVDPHALREGAPAPVLRTGRDVPAEAPEAEQ